MEYIGLMIITSCYDDFATSAITYHALFRDYCSIHVHYSGRFAVIIEKQTIFWAI